MSTTYMFIQKNGLGVLTLSAGSELEAWEILYELLKDPESWRLEETENED